jgi:endoglucanase Acf2
MNCNAGIILWGINTGNKAIRDMGISMYVNEARAIGQYWWDVDKAVFPSGYNHNAVGMLWTNGGAYTTWFSNDRSAIHGINFRPRTRARADRGEGGHVERDRGSAWIRPRRRGSGVQCFGQEGDRAA